MRAQVKTAIVTRIRTKVAAALTAAVCLALSASAIDVVKPTPAKTRVDVVFALDTTGSMSGLIDGAKRKVWSIANAIIDQNPNALIRLGLIGYRDIDDEYVVRYYPLTTDAQDIYAKLLAFQAEGGGDTPESVNEALDVAVTKMGWTEAGAGARIIFLVGDAPPHMDYEQDRKYPQVVAEARRRGIIVNAVQAGDMDSTRKIWREIARLGEGEYIAIPQDGGRIIVIKTPYDDEIIVIQRKLNDTVIPYGDVRAREIAESKLDSFVMAEASIAAETSKFVNNQSGGGGVITGGGDLIEAINNKSVKLKDVTADKLPENMRKMTAKEKETFVELQIKTRATLAKDLAATIAKRDAFIAAAQAKDKPEGDSFDRAVSRTLQKQVKK
ncbi:MAG: VWA domain-containing protein [Helicobacteraceae bacterium]|jgi:Mg-chelatase subunit ChlD|nr:VWA domain-containing protein [Helicobacteraceae bacterium]